jgi:hypothetical protein
MTRELFINRACSRMAKGIPLLVRWMRRWVSAN